VRSLLLKSMFTMGGTLYIKCDGILILLM